ncbi:C-myc promoter-binding protein [Dirofilaria immitis]
MRERKRFNKRINISDQEKNFETLSDNYLISDGWMRPLEKDISHKCWKCEPSPEELNNCDKNLLIYGRKCACNLNGRWEATVSSTIGNRNEVKELQCITSRDQTMNHISPYFTKIYR